MESRCAGLRPEVLRPAITAQAILLGRHHGSELAHPDAPCLIVRDLLMRPRSCAFALC
jgi:hypothetical protein